MDAKEVENVENEISSALREVAEMNPILGKPIAAWDGARRVWILRVHESGESIYREVITALSITDFEESIKIEITARAWSSAHRQTPALEESIFSAVVRQGEEFPNFDFLVGELTVGLDIVRRMGDVVEKAAEELESRIEQLTKYS